MVSSATRHLFRTDAKTPTIPTAINQPSRRTTLVAAHHRSIDNVAKGNCPHSFCRKGAKAAGLRNIDNETTVRYGRGDTEAYNEVALEDIVTNFQPKYPYPPVHDINVSAFWCPRALESAKCEGSVYVVFFVAGVAKGCGSSLVRESSTGVVLFEAAVAVGCDTSVLRE